MGSNIRVMLVGPLPPPMGGATRHFMTLYEDLQAASGFDVDLVNTSRREGFQSRFKNLAVFARTFWAITTRGWRSDIVSYHASNRGMFLFGPVVVLLCKILRKPVILRVFGGSFGDYHERKGRFAKLLIRRFILTADIFLLQTHRMIDQLQPVASGRLEWFSTYIREATPASRDIGHDRRSCSKFIFLGHMWKTKGVDTMLAAAPRLPETVSLDLFGTLDEYTAEYINERGVGRVRYCGFLTHDQVSETLREYDCLVLATYHPSEGYPGVIAEAYAHALPVISTRWLAIPEIVDESTGILIEPDQPDQLADAIHAMHANPQRWQRLKRGAASRAKDFNHAKWAQTFERLCAELLRGKSGADAA